MVVAAGACAARAAGSITPNGKDGYDVDKKDSFPGQSMVRIAGVLLCA